MPTKTFVKTTAFPVSQSNRSQKENHKGQVRCFSCLGGFTIFPRLDATITPKDLAAAERKLDSKAKVLNLPIFIDFSIPYIFGSNYFEMVKL